MDGLWSNIFQSNWEPASAVSKMALVIPSEVGPIEQSMLSVLMLPGSWPRDPKLVLIDVGSVWGGDSSLCPCQVDRTAVAWFCLG